MHSPFELTGRHGRAGATRGPDDGAGVARGAGTSGAVRVGDTVRRPVSPGAQGDPQLSGELLIFLERAGWAGAPRFLGVDGWGRQVLSFLDGHVAWDWEGGQPEAVGGDASLAPRAGALARELHDLPPVRRSPGRVRRSVTTICGRGTPSTATSGRGCGRWRPSTGISPRPVRGCTMSPGCAGSTPDGGRGRPGRGAAALPGDLCGVRPGRPSELVETVLWWQDRCWRGIDQAAEAGDPAMVRLRDSGAVEQVRAGYAWVARHRAELR